jgi:hypothetical protein
VLERAFVVIDEEARRSKPFGSAFPDLIELDRCGDGVRRAAIQGALAVNWRAMRAQIGAPRESAQ